MLDNFEVVAELEVGPGAQVLECGWQSWSPSGWYAAAGEGPRPRSPQGQVMGYRAGSPRWKGQFQSEGLLAVDLVDHAVTVTSLSVESPASLRAWLASGRLHVAADRPVRVNVHAQPAQVALSAWASEVAAGVRTAPLRPVPPGWCSWYYYERGVTAAAVLAEMELSSKLGLPVDIALLDEGYEQALGDWLRERDDFGELASLASTLRGMGKIPGIWLAPFVAARHSAIARAHPDWWLDGVSAGYLWNSHLLVLDPAADQAVDWLADTFASLVQMGFGFFKLDFLYAGTLPGGGRSWSRGEDVQGYRHVLRRIRDAIGPDPFLAGCGAPLLPSVGLFDSMRVSSDVGTNWEPKDEEVDDVPPELWYPSGSVPLRSCAARAFAHGNWWVNDPDCIMARPEMEGRERWAELVGAWPGLSLSGDALGRLDEEGLQITRRLLRQASPAPLGEAELLQLDDLGRSGQGPHRASNS